MKTPNPDLIEEIVRRVTSAVHPLRVTDEVVRRAARADRIRSLEHRS
jgi:hypothetical protein